MRALTEALLNQHYSESKEPYYVIELAFDDAATDLAYITSHSDTPVPSGATVFPGALKKISSTSQKIQPEQGRSTIGTFSVDLLDLGGAVTTLFKAKDIAGFGLRQRRVRAFMGYPGMTSAEILANPIQTQIIDGLDEEKFFFRLSCADIQRVTRKKIFEPAKTRLSQTIDNAQLTIPVLSVSSFQLIAHGSSYTDAPDRSVLYIKIEDEVIRCTGTTTDPQLGLSFVADLRGALNTLPAIHEVDPQDTDDRGQEVTEFIYLEMPAVKLAYGLLTGDLLDQPGETLPLNWHAGVDTQFVRQSDFESVGIDLYDPATDGGLIVRFAGEKPQDGKRFIETQINLLLGCFMPIYSDGQLGFKRFSNVLFNSPYVFELNDDNVVSHGQLKVDMRGVRNLLSVSWNYDFIRDKLTRQKILVDDVSRLKHKDAPAQSLSFRGLHGSRHTSTTLESLFDRLRDRYAGPPLRLSVKCLPHTNLLEVGDVVRVRLSGITDYQLGSTIDRSMEVQSVSINWDDGSVSIDLLGSSEGATPIGSSGGGLDNILPDSWYTSSGTDLATYPGVTINDIGGVGRLTAGTIVGGSSLEQGIYYYDGDLQVDAGSDLFIEKNVYLKVKGFFQVNGAVNGVGEGVQPLTPVFLDERRSNVEAGFNPFNNVGYEYEEHAAGVPGYIGPTVSAGGWRQASLNDPTFRSDPGYLTQGQVATVPALNIEYDGQGILGLPDSLMGTAGAQGRAVSRLQPNAVGGHSWHDNAGGAGGPGGAGFVVTCRGASIGVGGSIDVSGADGERAGSTYQMDFISGLSNDIKYAGSGAGGAPGAVLFLIDGLANTIPEIQNVTARFGSSPFPVTDFDESNTGRIPYQLTSPVVTISSLPAVFLSPPYSYFWGYGESPPDLSGFNGASKVFFIPPNLTAVEDDPEIFDGFYELPTLTNLQLASGTDTLLAAADGSFQERIQATWNVIADEYADGYEVQLKETISLETDWETKKVIVDTDAPLALLDVTEGKSYQVRVRAYSNRTTVKPSPWLQASDHIAQGKSVPPADPIGFTVAVQSDTGAVFNVNAHPDVDFKRYLFYQGATFATASFLFDASSVKSLSGPIASTDELTFWVVAEDRTGNQSNPASAIAAVSNPNQVVPSLSFEGADALIQWSIPASVFTIDYYEINISNSVVAESKSTSFRTRVTWQGSDTVSIVAVDIAGNRSNAADVMVSPLLPNVPVLQALKTAANQFKLVYSATSGSLPVDAYIVSVGSLVSPTEVLEKAGTSSFTTISEDAAGDYDYFVQARDTAGNIGAAGAITVRLEDSTDLNLILTNSQVSTSFAGVRTNILDDDGSLYLPIPDGRTWQAKYSSYASLQAKIDDGYPQFLQPSSANAIYVYTVDSGAVIAQATIQVTSSIEQIIGTVSAVIGLETSDDDVTYTPITAVNGAGQGIAFRYVRVTVTFTPAADTDYARLVELALNILTLAREESGTFISTATTGGDTILLTQPFADIQSIIATAKNFDQIEAAFDWSDPNPTQFKAQIFDKGTTTRYTGEVGYTVRGI